MSEFTSNHFNEQLYNLDAPSQIVPEIIKIVKPKSVVDVGCGTGTFLHCFKQSGIEEVLGIDGPWANKELLHKHLSPEEFKEIDLNKEEFNLNKKFDLVLSLEVANHLEEKQADTFIENLVNSGKIILFSAAVPFQGGDYQINFQWLSYWEKKFLKHDYVVHDVLRPLFWNNPKIFCWYKQNMVLVAPKDFEFENKTLQSVPKEMRDIVHYELHTMLNSSRLYTVFRKLRSLLGK
ncbi:class I SAM-dependent methyltransferase [Algibacter sp. 2305UL17-15]|uniref:class I SAM-dependent methyltransferase n=1 Tax=Algibacter sp. 2305UL17-15 TaxID=3231268 RepID=UPI003458B6DA